jgi:hypothetical protein
MCVETTAIMASAVEYLGMRPYFTIISGHAFLGVAVSPTAAGPGEFWETLLLGDQKGQVYGDQANVYGNGEYAKNVIVDTVDVQYWVQQGIKPIE